MTRTGAELGKADMHLHTLYSDGTASVQAVLDHVERATDLDLVTVREATRPLIRRLRAGGVVGIIGDRDLDGDGQPVTMFGHPTTMPIGPASLAVAHRAALVVGRCLRIGPDRFRAEGELVEVPATGDRRADTAVLVERIAARFEHDIGETPEQWWGAFQPFWPDLR